MDSAIDPKQLLGGMTIQELIAPFFLGIIVNYFFWGVQITQSYFYYKSYRLTDRKWIKVSVGLLFLCDAIQSVCSSEQGWRFMVEGWGDLIGVTQSPGWGSETVPLVDAVTASIVHSFYAQKIWTLLDHPYNYVLTGLVLAMSCLQLVGGIGVTGFTVAQRLNFAGFSRDKTWASTWLITATVTDIVITAIMTWKLSRSRTGYKKTDDIISKIILLTVETGLATAVVQFATILTYRVWITKAYYTIFASLVPKVYSNSMLALLNSRPIRNPNGTLDTSQERPVDSIRIHTSQTVTRYNDYELEDRLKGESKDPHSAQLTADGALSTYSAPFVASNHKLPYRGSV